MVYQLDWHLLPISERKELMMIMIRSTVPIKFTSGFLITLSHQSYSNVSIIIICIWSWFFINISYEFFHVQILKTSYSAFNLLQRPEI